jgi:hypothetical protein
MEGSPRAVQRGNPAWDVLAGQTGPARVVAAASQPEQHPGLLVDAPGFRCFKDLAGGLISTSRSPTTGLKVKF